MKQEARGISKNWDDIKGGKEDVVSRPRKPVVGLEAEFNIFVQEQKRLPEHVFKNPQRIVRVPMLPRTGRSFHLPSGGAIYFDTGVIEVATPIIEIEQGCATRAVRSLWEQIAYLRDELDAWEKRRQSTVRLQGFSVHYNVSMPDSGALAIRNPDAFAYLLTHILPIPVMILASNRMSTGVGVRPRGNRIEITADFTPDPDLMTATAALILGTVLVVMRWPSYGLEALEKNRIPVIAGFQPRKHTTRKGWLARFDCFPRNPFTADINAEDWLMRDGRTLSLRTVASEIALNFLSGIKAFADEDSFEHIFAVFEERARSLLDFSERPSLYDDVGRVINWKRRSIRALPRSNYEKIIHRILTRRDLQIGNSVYQAERMQGWYEIVFRNTRTGLRRVFNLDDLARRCSL